MEKIPGYTRYAKKVALENGYEFELLDRGEGCLFRISNSKKNFIAGSGSISSSPLNNAFSASVARDKIFTNYLLDINNIPNLGGRCFFLTEDGIAVRGEGYEIEDAHKYFKSLSGTGFCKPLNGSQGNFAEIIRTGSELEDYILRCSKKFDAIIIQPYYEGIEYRVFMLGSEPLFCIRKNPVEIFGDGKSNLRELLEEINKQLLSQRISAYPQNVEVIDKRGATISLEQIPLAGEILYIPGRKNISSGAIPSMIDPIPQILVDLSKKAHQSLSLEISGIDFICKEEDNNILEAKIVEINASPAISSLEILDRWDLIERIWLHVIEKMLG